jgi:hypothetical protein
MATRESRHTVIGIIIVALIAGTLLAGGVASVADEILRSGPCPRATTACKSCAT